LDLLNKINESNLFHHYRLVGGTALALIHGHRKSIDLDFFGNQKIDSEDLITFLHSIGNVREFKTSKKIDSLILDDVKIDIVFYPYEWIDSPLIEENIRLASSKEIAAMKIAAIINRGSKKDFIDLNEFYKNTNKSLIIIPTKHKINYDRDDLLKDEITKNITGYENRFTWSSRLTRAVLNIKLD
jgi:predicted nucleotidyltransferase component of viral defense system